MKLLLIAAAFLGLAVLAREASAEETKPAKPSVCLVYSLAKSDAGTVAICHDGKKPALYSRFSIVEVPGKDSGSVRVLVGWR